MNSYIKQNGVTLIEVLVAIIITSVGILGFASLQFLGLNSNSSAYQRSQATFIATDLSERMRANIEGMNDNQYAAFNSNTLNCGTIAGNFCDERNNAGTAIGAAACTAAERAAHDLFVTTCGYSSNDYTDFSEKSNFIGDLLQNGNIQIACNDSVTTDADVCTDNSDHTITISWFELDEQATGGKLDFNDTGPSSVKSVVYRVRL